MKKHLTLFLFFLIILFSEVLFSQNDQRLDSLKQYFKTHEKSLDQIEGFWELNVINKLFENDSIIAEKIETQRSYWAIAKLDETTFKILDISEGLFDSNFDAQFEKLPTEDHYFYTCHFKNPKWSSSSISRMIDGDTIIYEYFVSDVFLIDAYGPDAGGTLNLKWEFIWLKIDATL